MDLGRPWAPFGKGLGHLFGHFWRLFGRFLLPTLNFFHALVADGVQKAFGIDFLWILVANFHGFLLVFNEAKTLKNIAYTLWNALGKFCFRFLPCICTYISLERRLKRHGSGWCFDISALFCSSVPAIHRGGGLLCPSPCRLSVPLVISFCSVSFGPPL